MSASDEGWTQPARRPWPRRILIVAALLAGVGGVLLAVGDDLTGEGSQGQLTVQHDAPDEDGGAEDAQSASTEFGGSVTAGLAHSQIWSLALGADGTVWAGTDRGLSRFDGQKWTTDTRQGSPGADSVISVAAGDGSVWATTEGLGGVSRSDGEEWTRYGADDGLPRFVTSVETDEEGTLWASSPKGLWRFEDGRWDRIETYRGLEQGTITSVAEAADGLVWATTYEGLARFDGRGWQRYTTADGLAGSAIGIGSVAAAEDGTLWVGTRQGLSRFAGGQWTSYTTEDGLVHDAVTAVAVTDRGTVWVGTQQGLSRFAGGEWTSYTTEDGLVHDSITAVGVTDRGTVWVGTRGGVSRFADGDWTTYTGAEGFAPDA